MEAVFAMPSDVIRQEGRQEGKQEGKLEGIEESIILVLDLLDDEIISKRFKMSIDKIQKLRRENNKL